VGSPLFFTKVQIFAYSHKNSLKKNEFLLETYEGTNGGGGRKTAS